MSFNQEKIFNVLKTSLAKITSEEVFVNTFKKNLSQYIEKVSSITKSGIALQNFRLNFILSGRKHWQSNTVVLGNNENELSSSSMVTDINTISKSDKKDQLNYPLLWRPEISKTHIISQVNHILTSIINAQTDSSFQSRLQAFICYVGRVPDARIISVKEGAIQILLHARKRYKNGDQAALREALALLGYTDGVPGKGIRILSIDGGGVRGLLVLEMLKKLEELTGKRVYELFDLICGTSTGAILAFSIGIHHKSLDTIGKVYLDISNEVFKQSPIWGTSNLVWTQSYYSTPLWEKNLKNYLGDDRLITTARNPLCPKLCAVSAVVNQTHLSAYLFRNYSLPAKVQSQYLGSCEHTIWEAARASAAAPTYFEEFKLGEFIHQDGGILVNNPTAIAIHEAKLLWPNDPIQCVVSFGTGRTVPSSNKEKNMVTNDSINTSWKNKFFKILDSATDTEGVHIMLNDLMADDVYYRFNPYLTEMISMVEINEAKLEQLKRDALMYLRRNEDKFHAVSKTLTEPKSYLQQSRAWLNGKRYLYGF